MANNLVRRISVIEVWCTEILQEAGIRNALCGHHASLRVCPSVRNLVTAAKPPVKFL